MKKKEVGLSKQDETIIYVISNNEPIRYIEIKEILDKADAQKKVKCLDYRLGKLEPRYIQHKRWSRAYSLYFLQGHEYKAIERYEKDHSKNKKGNINVDYNTREKHTNDIKENIIVPWLNNLPRAIDCKNLPFGYRFDYIYPMKLIYSLERDLIVESNLFFLDFKNHLRTDDPLKKHVLFKKKSKELREITEKIIQEIKLHIKQQLNLKKRNGNIPLWFPCRIFQILLEKEENKKLVTNVEINFNDFESQITIDDDRNVVYKILPPESERYQIFKFGKNVQTNLILILDVPAYDQLSIEKMKKDIDKNVSRLPLMIVRNENINNMIRRLLSLKVDLIKLNSTIRKSLEEYNAMPIFPGLCGLLHY